LRIGLPALLKPDRKNFHQVLRFINPSLSFLVHYRVCPTSGHRVAPVHSV
jgi:hypothetical protein